MTKENYLKICITYREIVSKIQRIDDPVICGTITATLSPYILLLGEVIFKTKFSNEIYVTSIIANGILPQVIPAIKNEYNKRMIAATENNCVKNYK